MRLCSGRVCTGTVGEEVFARTRRAGTKRAVLSCLDGTTTAGSSNLLSRRWWWLPLNCSDGRWEWGLESRAVGAKSVRLHQPLGAQNKVGRLLGAGEGGGEGGGGGFWFWVRVKRGEEGGGGWSEKSYTTATRTSNNGINSGMWERVVSSYYDRREATPTPQHLLPPSA